MHVCIHLRIFENDLLLLDGETVTGESSTNQPTHQLGFKRMKCFRGMNT